MHRLFVAIRPPKAVRDRLLELMGGVSGARWQTDEQLHLTLRFIGELHRHQARDIHAALGSIHHPRSDLTLSGIGSFDRRGEPVTLWAGVSPHEPLKALHKKVDQAVARLGVGPAHRAYVPHITLARIGRGAGSIQPLLEMSGGVSSPTFAVEHFALFESRLSPAGAVYSEVDRFSLD